MGDLATTHGFYSADWDDKTFGVGNAMGEGGEALTVTDPDEAWMFHIVSSFEAICSLSLFLSLARPLILYGVVFVLSQTPDPSGASAVWVAQRVPDSHVTVVANTFVIRRVDPDSSDFLYSRNLWSVAEEKGWWSAEDGLLDFLLTYSPQRYHPNYSNRR
jgi:dipeptidase